MKVITIQRQVLKAHYDSITGHSKKNKRLIQYIRELATRIEEGEIAQVSISLLLTHDH